MPADVKRLRDMAGLLRLMDQHSGHRESHEAAASLLEKAADEIERKDRALREIADYRPPSSFDDPYHLIAIFSKKTARAALSPATPMEEMSNETK